MTATRTNSILILRRRPKAAVSKDVASWFETPAFGGLLTMRIRVQA
jgi:hypothetical protein